MLYVLLLPAAGAVAAARAEKPNIVIILADDLGYTVAGAGSPGNLLFLTEGAWNVFRDVSERMGIRNEQAYNGQPCFGDVNNDGKLSPAEMPGRTKQVFERFDTNNDGFLDGEEPKALAEQVRAVRNR